MGQELLTDEATIYVGVVKKTFKLYKDGSAQKHAASDDTTLKQALIRALNGPDNKKQHQGGGVYRVRINDGKGYLVYKLGVNGPDSASIFHYHLNYNLDKDLTVPTPPNV